MRIPLKGFATLRLVLVLLVVVGSVLLSSSDTPIFTTRDAAYYADPNLVNFVRPGLNYRITRAEIAADGTIKAWVRITDPRGLPLDREGLTTPGAISGSWIAAYIPRGQRQYVAYTTRTQTSPITGRSAIQAGADAPAGRWEKIADGEYTYTFTTKAPASIDRTATHAIGVYGNRNLNEFELGVNLDDDVYVFVPAGGTPQQRDIIKTATCNKCHDRMQFHGTTGRVSMEMCNLCHTPQTTDPDTGNTVDMVVMTHRIHMGANLPSVKAGRPYRIIGNAQSLHDYSKVIFPAYGGTTGRSLANCQACHESGKGAAHENAWLQNPSRAACGESCHDNVNFATGEGHVNLPQANDNQCATCHTPQGEIEFDASIRGAHTIPDYWSGREGLVIDILRVQGQAGQRPTVTFTLKNAKGEPVQASSLVGGANRLAAILAGPTTDYGETKFGTATTAGYVSEDATRATCAADGTCTYQFTNIIPADAKGTFSVGMEGRRSLVVLPGTRKEVTTQYGAQNKVAYFSVDGSRVEPRRQVVSTAKCNACHVNLSLHGSNRNETQHCVICHNAKETDVARRPVAVVPAERTKPPQSIDFALMVHKIHTGEHMKQFGRDYTVLGFGGAVHPYDEVVYPGIGPNSAIGYTGTCDMCHVNGSQNLPLRPNLLAVTDPQGPLNPMGKVTAACTSCHQSIETASHALANTTEKLGESCTVCHGPTSEFSVGKVHAVTR